MKLLFVEDDPGLREVYTRSLRHFGYDVVEAGTGAEGLRLARESRPDVILMDLVLPEMDGWEATRILKHDEATASIPVIAFTVHAHDLYRKRSEEAGCDLFIGKPHSPRRLHEQIEDLLTPPGGG